MSDKRGDGDKEIAKKKIEEVNQPETKFKENQPVFDKSLSLSKDGKWLIIRAVRIDFVHVNYLDKIREGNNLSEK